MEVSKGFRGVRQSDAAPVLRPVAAVQVVCRAGERPLPYVEPVETVRGTTLGKAAPELNVAEVLEPTTPVEHLNASAHCHRCRRAS
jgi:hypothetical protein